MTRKNTKHINKLQSDFNFRFLSKKKIFSIDTLIFIFLIIIFLMLIILFYLDYKTTQRFDSLFVNYQILFDRQSEMNNKLEAYIKDSIFENNLN